MNVKKEGQTLVLIPGIDLVASRIEELRDQIATHLKTHYDINHIILDARGIETVDSLGVNLIIGLYREAVSEKKTMEVIHAGKNFMKIAGFFRFSSLFPVGATDTEESRS